MSEKDRNKAGLHKKISSIFSGVVIPQSKKQRKPSDNSVPEDTDYNESELQVSESQESEPSMSDQPRIELPREESSTESKADSTDESSSINTQDSEVVSIGESSDVEPAQQSDEESIDSQGFVVSQDSKDVPIEQPEVEPIQQSDEGSVESQEFVASQDSEDVPVEQPEVEPIQPSDEGSVESQEFVASQDSEDIPVEQSEVEPVQRSNEKTANPPKFLTAQDSKDVPVEQSDEKSGDLSEFVTASGSKVIPISESDVEPGEQLEVEPVQQSKAEQNHEPGPETSNKQDKTAVAKKSKVIAITQSKADIDNVVKKKTKVKVTEQSFWNQITTKLLTPKSGTSPMKQKVMVVMIPVLFIFLLIFVFKGGVFGTSANNVNAGEENSSGVASAALNTQIEWKIPEPYPATTLRDPMRLGSVGRKTDQSGSGSSAKIKVKGILYSEDGSSSAIIDNRIVHEGDQIRGVNIIKINKENVEFESNGETWTLEVKG